MITGWESYQWERWKNTKKANIVVSCVVSAFLLVPAISLTRGNTIYVNDDAPGPIHDGSTWTYAYTDLQDALDDPCLAGGDAIWVATGTYYPTVLTDPCESRTAIFQAKNGVAIYGGLTGTEDPATYNLDDRDFEPNKTVLSGDLARNDGPNQLDNNEENCYHVFYHPDGVGLDDSAVLDGLTITAGNANGLSPHDDGGGMYNYNSNPTLTNCQLSNNTASSSGGGMYNYNSDPALTNCQLSNNIASSSGGGMYNYNSDPLLTNCQLSNNTTSYGGGIYNRNSRSTITNCRLSGNIANSYGGGIYNLAGSNPNIANCQLSGNSASYGGGIYNYKSEPNIANCQLSGNSASHLGGAIRNYTANPTLTNCTITGNSASSGGAMANGYSSSPTVTNCILWGNTAPIDPQISNYYSSTIVTYSDVQGGHTGAGNIDTDPLFVDADGRDDTFGTDDDDLHLLWISPCIEVGDPAGSYSGQLDMDADYRIRYDNVDIGADEVYPIAGDFEPDEDIDIIDLATFTTQWLDPPDTDPNSYNSADVNTSDSVDMTDYAIISYHWLAGAP